VIFLEALHFAIPETFYKEKNMAKKKSAPKPSKPAKATVRSRLDDVVAKGKDFGNNVAAKAKSAGSNAKAAGLKAAAHVRAYPFLVWT
jgi:hypothetical protein